MSGAETSSVGAIATALRRKDTYLGHAREAANLARCVASYPKGVFDAAITFGRPAGDGRHDTPVLLVHGFGHNRSAWFVLERHLRNAGFTSVQTFNYNPFRHDVPEIAARLRERVELLRAVTGAEKVHLVGHSLGGVVSRWFVQELGGADWVESVVTVASPHRGTPAAHLGQLAGRRTAKQLLPGSDVVRRLNSKPLPSGIRWVAYYSNLDLLVQGDSAKLPGAANLLVKDHGHVSVLWSQKVARSIVHQLEASEGVPGTASVRGIGSRPSTSAAGLGADVVVDAAAGS